MPSSTFASFSQNGEDVVLWRALRNIGTGRYIDVGANDPQVFSVSMGFYQRGWSGITIEPDPGFAQMHRDQRPRDHLVQAAVTQKDGDRIRFHVVDGTGLSTLDRSLARAHEQAGYETHVLEVNTRRIDSILQEMGWEGLDIHFMSVDTEGSEKGVIESFDLGVWRPWVLVVEAVAPLSTQSTRGEWEHLVLESDYEFCLFDGISCFYVAREHADALRDALSYPACALDDYTRRELRELADEAGHVAELTDQVSHWRAQTVARWASLVGALTEVDRLRVELAELHRDYQSSVDTLHGAIDELRQSTSWRLTRPLRVLGGIRLRRRHR